MSESMQRMRSSFDEVRDIRQIFGRLKPKERDLLWLAYVEGFSHSEIAGMVQAGAASIRPRRPRGPEQISQVC